MTAKQKKPRDRSTDRMFTLTQESLDIINNHDIVKPKQKSDYVNQAIKEKHDREQGTSLSLEQRVADLQKRVRVLMDAIEEHEKRMEELESR